MYLFTFHYNISHSTIKVWTLFSVTDFPIVSMLKCTQKKILYKQSCVLVLTYTMPSHSRDTSLKVLLDAFGVLDQSNNGIFSQHENKVDYFVFAPKDHWKKNAVSHHKCMLPECPRQM